MKKLASLPCLFACLLLAACSAPTAPEDEAASSEEAYSSSQWTKLLTCNGGAAVLDVDKNERRNVQLVIRDRAAVDYLQSKSPSNITNARHEIIITPNEQLKHGLFSPSDFGRDDFWRYHVADFAAYAGIVKRDGRGLKVILSNNFQPICEGGQWGYQGGCWGGHTIRANVYTEVANWYFDDCR
jgi:hypothetical protein